MASILEAILKDKEELIKTVLNLLEGKEARATLNLDGLEFNIGKSKVKTNGKIEIVFVPIEKKK